MYDPRGMFAESEGGRGAIAAGYRDLANPKGPFAPSLIMPRPERALSRDLPPKRISPPHWSEGGLNHAWEHTHSEGQNEGAAGERVPGQTVPPAEERLGVSDKNRASFQ